MASRSEIKSLQAGPYRVVVAENSHYQDRDAEYEIGGFATAEEALAKCREIVDSSLSEGAAPGRSADDIFGTYKMFGEDPYAYGPEGALNFSAWDYAKARAPDFVKPGGT